MTLDSTYGIQMPPLTAVNVLFMKRQHLATRALRVLPRAEAPHHVNEKHQSRTKLLDIWSSFISRCKKTCKFYAYVWAIAILDSFSRTSMLSMHMPNLSWSKLWTNQFPMSVPFWGSLDLVWHQAHNKTNDKANPNTRSSHMWGYQHQNIMSTYTTVWNKGSTLFNNRKRSWSNRMACLEQMKDLVSWKRSGGQSPLRSRGSRYAI